MGVIEDVKQLALQEKLVVNESDFDDSKLEKAIESVGISLGGHLSADQIDIIRKEVLENPNVYKLYKLEPKRQLILKKKMTKNRRFI